MALVLLHTEITRRTLVYWCFRSLWFTWLVSKGNAQPRLTCKIISIDYKTFCKIVVPY